MFTLTPERTKLQASIDRAHEALLRLDPASEEYGIALDRLVKLHKMEAEDRPRSVSPDTIVSAAASLIGILLILHYERTEIVTTKAISFVPKMR